MVRGVNRKNGHSGGTNSVQIVDVYGGPPRFPVMDGRIIRCPVMFSDLLLRDFDLLILHLGGTRYYLV